MIVLGDRDFGAEVRAVIEYSQRQGGTVVSIVGSCESGERSSSDTAISIHSLAASHGRDASSSYDHRGFRFDHPGHVRHPPIGLQSVCMLIGISHDDDLVGPGFTHQFF